MQTPAPFGYERATSVDHAIQLLEQLGPDARLVAGGHSFIPMMKLRLAQPEHVIDINPLYAELGSISIDANHLVIGAMARHNDLLDSAIVGEHFPVLHDAERVIADPVVRNRGTIGGSLCQADPCRGPLRGAVGAQSRGRDPRLGWHPHRARARTAHRAVRDGGRGMPRSSPRSACRSATDVAAPTRRSNAAPATGRSPPSPPSCGWTATRSPMPVSGWCAVGAEHFVSTEAEAALIGNTPDEAVIEAAALAAAASCNPVTDQRGPAEYKRHLAGELTRRALRRAVARAQGVE